MKNNAAVVIPYYHSELTALEKISFQNCTDMLGSHPIILVVPEKMPETDYPEGENLIYKQVPDEWLASVESYNKMMACKEFYQLFMQYEYILIFQLDAFVFSDRLGQFCGYGYDYIGAPWLGGMRYIRTIAEGGMLYVGNGGFSLRKVSAFLDILMKETANGIDVHEDVFWSSHASGEFHVAPPDIALKFSFERDVRLCFKLNDNELPFGCHAWERYDFDFWEPIFEQMGYGISVQMPKGEDERDKIIDMAGHYLNADSACVKSALNRLPANGKICVFGIGMLGEECVWLLKHNGIDNLICVDNSEGKWGNYIWGTLIESPEAIPKADNALIIIAAARAEIKREILSQLKSKGHKYKHNAVFYSDLIEMIQDGQADGSAIMHRTWEIKKYNKKHGGNLQ